MTRSDPLELDAWAARRRVVEDARAVRLTPREWLRAYGVVWLAPFYAMAVLVLLALMGGEADLEAAAMLGFAAMVATAVGFVHVFWRFLEWRFGRHEDRRTQTVLRRAVVEEALARPWQSSEPTNCTIAWAPLSPIRVAASLIMRV